MNGLLAATDKKYDKVLFTPHNWWSSLRSSRDLTFLCVAHIRWNNSHEVIARSHCDETCQNPWNRLYVWQKRWQADFTDLSHSDTWCSLELLVNPKSTGLFPPGAALGGGVFHSQCKIRSRHPRKLKFTGLIAYVMFNKICKFESLTIINDVIMTSLTKQWENGVFYTNLHKIWLR